jgi:putative FmdB family regulatory protein
MTNYMRFQSDFLNKNLIVKGEGIMPTYEFICEKCDKPFTLTMKISEYEKTKFRCPGCKSTKVRQQITSFQTITSSKS